MKILGLSKEKDGVRRPYIEVLDKGKVFRIGFTVVDYGAHGKFLNLNLDEGKFVMHFTGGVNSINLELRRF